MEDNYWVNISHRKNSVICNWNHYVICAENSPFKGFDGRKFKITYLDDSTVYTTNLWLQGTIPEQYRHLFKNNTKSVENV